MRSLSWSILLSGVAGLGLLALAAPANAEEWGTIKGEVVYGGDKVPAPKDLQVTKDQAHCLSRGPIPDEEWVISPKNKGVRWAFVWLEPMEAGGKLPVNPALKEAKDKEVVVDQPCCRFEPHALALRQGQVLVAKNSAPIAHNVNWTGGAKNPGNNVIVPPGGRVEIKDLVASRLPVSIACNIHGWMKAYARIFDHPYFAVTDADGAFEIKDAPAGEYRLVVWHEAVGWRDRETVNGKSVIGKPITIKPNTVNDLGKLDLKETK